MSMPKAVIVEDDFKLSELYKTVLEQCQYETTIIGSGREAQKKFQTSVPKLIILDVHLPYISGLDLLKELQEDERFNNTLIIIVTADVYTANSLEGKVKNVILKTYGINKLSRLATDHLKAEG